MTNTEIASASKIMLGSTEAQAMYIGDNLIWEKLSIPYDCQIEYLEVNGNQHINTGVVASEYPLKLKTEVYINNTSNEKAIWGNNYDQSDSYSSCVISSGLYNGKFFSWGGSTSWLLNGTCSANTWYEVEFGFPDANTKTMVINGTNYSSNTSNGSAILNENPIYLFFNGRYTNTRMSGRMKYAKLYVGGILVRDFIPVRVGLVGYMYDKITKQLFGNLGTGSFTLGPDIVEVEYLESTGTLYINTDYQVWNYGLSGEIKMLRIGDHTGYDGYIGRTTSGGLQLYYRSGMGIVLWLDRGSNNFDIPTNSSYYDTNIHVVLFGITSTTSYISVDGDTYSVTDSLDTRAKAPILLFSHRGYYNAEGRIYYCKLYDNDTPVLDLIPVRIGQVGYMYDKISGKLFGNNGTGNFTLGPDKQ